MNRHKYFFIKNLKTINSCGNDIISLNATIFEKQFEIKYFPDKEHNLDTCESCKKIHKTIIKQVKDQYKKFPFCCEYHSNLAKKTWFDKNDFKNLPKLVADKIMFTHHHIINKLDEDDWKDEIINYIDYAVESFGSFPANCGEPLALSNYFRYVINLLKNIKLEGEDKKYIDRQKFIINYIKNFTKPSKKTNTDFNLLLSTYDKWYKHFPFDIALFENLKNHFSRQIPIVSEKSKYNPYLGTLKMKIISQEELLDYLKTITNQILISIDTTKLLENEYIKNSEKYNLDLKKKVHRLNQKSLFEQYSKGEKKYIKTIKKWLFNEREFMQGIQPELKFLLKSKENQKTQTMPKLKLDLSVPQLALLFKMINDLKPKIVNTKSNAQLFRFISSNFQTKKSSEKGISTQKLRNEFNNPELKAIEFWETHLHTMLSNIKKLK